MIAQILINAVSFLIALLEVLVTLTVFHLVSGEEPVEQEQHHNTDHIFHLLSTDHQAVVSSQLL
jgi:hypothetical protein